VFVGAKSSATAASFYFSGICFGFVNLVFCLVCAICPFAVAIVSL
jgi:hypothetical protein